jgi:uncharacterized surface anchored protein
MKGKVRMRKDDGNGREALSGGNFELRSRQGKQMHHVTSEKVY